ncbi:hypothetical protein ENBRE01_0084 [Enteropsectra breve]|nr:hypothetical protein ENBRE01_0084 [Enteropsectra breve]
MSIIQQYLTVTTNEPAEAINTTAQAMLKSIVAEIKMNKSTRKNGDLVHEISETTYILPKIFSEDKVKTKWEKFAEEKGIKKRKRPARVFSEEAKKFLPRWGSASNENMKMRAGLVESDKSISELKREKQKRIEKNKKNRDANIKRSRE